MPFPVVQNTAITQNQTGSASITMPSGIVAGQLLMIICGVAATHSISGYTQSALLHETSINSYLSINTKFAVGGDTASLTVASGSVWSSIAVNIANVDPTLTLSSIPNAGVDQGNTTAAPDPPNLATGTTRDYLWVVCCGGGTTVSGAPTNYSGFVKSLANANAFTTGYAWRQLTAATENPGTFSGSIAFPFAITAAIAGAKPIPAIQQTPIVPRMRAANW